MLTKDVDQEKEVEKYVSASKETPRQCKYVCNSHIK